MFEGQVIWKQKAQFHWCMKDKADIIFLSETYSTPKVENAWKSQWSGSCFLVLALNTLVKEGLDYELKVCKQDELGRYVILKLLCKVNNLFLQISMLQIMATSNVFLWWNS